MPCRVARGGADDPGMSPAVLARPADARAGRPTRSRAMICQDCGRDAPTMPIRFSAVWGLVVPGPRLTNPPFLCKSCAHCYFWAYTVITVLGGWWSLPTLLLTPFV